MKQIGRAFCFVWVVILLLAVFITPSGTGLTKSSVLTGQTLLASEYRLEDSFGQPKLPHDFSGQFIVSSYNNPQPGGGLTDFYRQIRPLWNQPQFRKDINPSPGFFFAILVILLFFIFYRNSRNVAGSEADPNFSDSAGLLVF